MMTYKLFRSAQAIRTIIATDLADALSQCADEMPSPTMMRDSDGAFQWVNGTAFELLACDPPAPAVITLYAKTHRDACLYGCTDADAVAYDDAFPAFVDRLTAAAAREGFALQVNTSEQRASSYTTDDDAAHDFMQSHAADFWAHY